MKEILLKEARKVILYFKKGREEKISLIISILLAMPIAIAIVVWLPENIFMKMIFAILFFAISAFITFSGIYRYLTEKNLKMQSGYKM